MNTVAHELIACVRFSMYNDSSVSIDFSLQEDIWTMAKRNHLEVIVYQAALASGYSGTLMDEMQNTFYSMVARDVQQSHHLNQVESALKKAGVHYGLQKGSILKGDYPQRQQRFMSDLDICIRPEDRERIREAMHSIGATYRGTESGDDQFLMQGVTGVEFHGRLLYRKHGSVIESYPSWDMVDEGCDRLTEEGYALNLIGHAVGDLAKGGLGVRYVLDLWVYRHRHEPQPDWEFVWGRLKEDGIDEAVKNLLDLSEYLFGEGDETPLMVEMADYVLSGGLYGDARRASATELSRPGGRVGAMARQVFRNSKEYENRFPWLIGRPYLYPAAVVMRLVQSFTKHRTVISSWLKRLSSASESEVKLQRERLRRFGL